MPCHAIFCHVMHCHAMPCHIIPYIVYQVLLFSRCGCMKFEMHIYNTCTLTLYQGVFKMSYSCQHFNIFLLLFPKTIFKSLIAYVAMKSLCHVICKLWYVMPCHVMKKIQCLKFPYHITGFISYCSMPYQVILYPHIISFVICNWLRNGHHVV